MTEPLPPSRQIAADLREAIRSGEYRPGHQIPSGRVLSERYDVARQTVQKAIEMLRGEGLIVGQQGAGWFVRKRPTLVRLSRSRLARSEREAGRGASVTDAAQGGWDLKPTVTIRFEPAGERIATELRIDPRDEVLVRDRVMHADDEPVQLATSRLPRSITAGTMMERENTGPGGVYARLEESGHILERFEERVTTRAVTDGEAVRLRVDLGTPVLAITRIAYAAGDVPVEINDMVLDQRYELVYELPAD